MHSDDLFESHSGSSLQWEGLEKRVNRLLESVVQLRAANGQLMKENAQLKKQLREASESPDGSPEEMHKLRGQYDQAMKDLGQVKQNLQRIESLADQLKLEDHSTEAI